MKIQILLTSCVIISACITTSCVSTKEGKAIRDEVGSVQERVVLLEGSLNQKEKSLRQDSESANLRVASTASRLEDLEQQIKRIKGDIDALRVGVATGKLPGAEEAPEGSVAQTLSELVTRIDQVESNQAEIVAAIEKSVAKSSKSGKKSGDKTPKDKEAKDPPSGALKSVGDLEAAFAQKRYKQVVEQAPGVLTKTKGKDAKLRLSLIQAESQFKLGKFQEAAVKYSDYLDAGPDSAKVPMIKMRIADCFRRLGDKATAKLFYEEVVTKFAKSPQATKAREQLSRLEGGA